MRFKPSRSLGPKMLSHFGASHALALRRFDAAEEKKREMTNSRAGAIGVYGLGYVGCVSAVCLAIQGFRVVGVDVNADKIHLLERGQSPVIENSIGELTEQVIKDGTLTVTCNTPETVKQTSISLVCVGTPSTLGGGLSTKFLEQVTAEIGRALGELDRWHVVVYRSTMLPGTCRGLLIPMLEKYSGKRAGVDFGVCLNPEYLREGTSVADFFDPPKIVIGANDSRSRDSVSALYESLEANQFDTSIEIAEMTKYVDNSFHAMKVCFANEIGAICSSLELDSHEVMKIFLSDTKLNLGPSYLQPGFAFGGSCLPKDVRALTYIARNRQLEVPLISNLLNSNESHLRRALELAVEDGRRKVGIFGLSFKPGTDDLRESPMVELAERLIGKGFSVKIYDANVNLSRLIGANQFYIEEKLPHIGELLMDDINSVVEHGDILIVGSNAPDIVKIVAASISEKYVIDLVRMPHAPEFRGSANYRGIAW